MTRRQKDPLRPLTGEERDYLERVSRSGSAPAAQGARAKEVLAVADGHSYTEAAQLAGRKSGDAVSQLVSRFNQEGIRAIEPRHGGGPPLVYGPRERERIRQEVRRTPDRAQDGTAPDGLPAVSTFTIRRVLMEAGWSYQRDGTWCETGQVKRKRKGQMVTVLDPDTAAKKTLSNGPTE